MLCFEQNCGEIDLNTKRRFIDHKYYTHIATNVSRLLLSAFVPRWISIAITMEWNKRQNGIALHYRSTDTNTNPNTRIPKHQK